jgi:hypothetical protein
VLLLVLLLQTARLLLRDPGPKRPLIPVMGLSVLHACCWLAASSRFGNISDLQLLNLVEQKKGSLTRFTR